MSPPASGCGQGVLQVPPWRPTGNRCRLVAPGEVLEQQMDAGLMLDIASLGLEVDLENSGKRRQIQHLARIHHACEVRSQPGLCVITRDVPSHAPMCVPGSACVRGRGEMLGLCYLDGCEGGQDEPRASGSAAPAGSRDAVRGGLQEASAGCVLG